MNRYLNQRKIVSNRKFERLFSQNLHLAGVAYTTDKQWNTKNSLQAVCLNGFVYAKFPCKDQSANRLETFCVRYSLENPLDFIMFQPYPSSVIPVEF